MLVLGVESATDVSGAALADESGVLAAATVARGRRHGETVAPAVHFVCERAGVALGDLDAVAVDVGPGLFTGLRVGVSTAKGLGFALSVPVVEVGSLEALAVEGAARRGPWRVDGAVPALSLVPVVDARRGQVFAGRFRCSAAGEVEQVGEDRLMEPQALARELGGLAQAGSRVVCPGDGAVRYAELVTGAGAVVLEEVRWPDPGVIARLGLSRFRSGGGREASKVTARYLRPADVRINWETRFAAPKASEP